MRTLYGLGILLGVVGCEPSFAYTRVVGPGRFELACPGGLRDCGEMASNLCPSGYQVQGTKSATTSSGATIECAPAKVADASPVCPTVAARPKPQCSADYQCTEAGSRCAGGSCVVTPATFAADEADRCVVGRGTSGEPVPMFPTTKALTEYMTGNIESRAEAFMSVARLDGLWIDAGVRCRTLGQFDHGKRVQLLSGKFAGREGWFYSAPAAQTESASVSP